LGEFGNELTPAGFEDALFGVGEGGEVRGREFVEGELEVVEARLDRGGRGTQGRSALLVRARLRGARIAQERLARGRIDRRAAGGQERLGLSRGEGMELDGLGEPSLLRHGEGRQGARDGERQPPAVDAGDEVGCEAAREGQAAVDPGGLLAEEF